MSEEQVKGHHPPVGEGALPPTIAVDSIVRFDGTSVLWRVRGLSEHGRFAVCTAKIRGQVVYTVLDAVRNIRGPLNIIGGGMGITTLEGPDDNVDDVLRALAGTDPEWGEGWEVSRRNSVPLQMVVHSAEA